MIQTERITTSRINNAIYALNKGVKHLNKCVQDYLGVNQFQAVPKSYAIVNNNANHVEQGSMESEKPATSRMKIKFKTRRNLQPKIWR